MKKSPKVLEFTFERIISASPEEVYDAWLNPKVSGTPWNAADKLILNPEVDGFYYLLHGKYPHYGRFLKLERPTRIQHTWVSPNTLGEESRLTLTFKKQEKNTIMTLVHSDIPNSKGGRMHEAGWEYYLGVFSKHFKKNSPSENISIKNNKEHE